MHGKLQTFFTFFMAMLCSAALLPQVSVAAGAKSFAVMPVSVHGDASYAYLEKAIPQMLSSRLFLKDSYESVAQSEINAQKKPTDEASAALVQKNLAADFLVWGSVTVMGENCSLDMRVLNDKGAVTPVAKDTTLNQLIPALKSIADTINSDAFKRPVAAKAAAPVQKVNQMNAAFTHNETSSNQQVYMNPQFRYAGNSDTSYLRSQALPYAARAMQSVDLDSDKRTEILLLDEHYVRAYRFEQNKLIPVGEYKTSLNLTCVSMSVADINRDGLQEIVVNAYDADTAPQAFILTWNNGKFSLMSEKIHYYLRAVKMAPDYRPVLLGQASAKPKLFRPGVYEMAQVGDGKWIKGRKLDLPKEANVLNFEWLPDASEEGPKLMVLNNRERLVLFTEQGGRIAETENSFSGSSTAIPVDMSMANLGEDTLLQKDMYYIPQTMLAANLDEDNRYEMLVIRPISTAAQFFERYRFFPQSEIHSLYYDGVGLTLQWKTRRIKGSIVGFSIADVFNDGSRNLVVAVNSHPGQMGMSARKTYVLVYPLDLSKDAADSAIAREFTEEQ